jgi:hypothetical protein
MDEFGAALQFFDAFGENWYALKECLCYLDEWLPGDSYLLVITEPFSVLIKEEDQELSWLIQTIREVGEWWKEPIVNNGRFNRGPIPFHTILQATVAEREEVLRRFGPVPTLTRRR